MTVTHHFRISPQFFVFLIFHEIIRMEYVNLFWKKFVIIVIRGFQFLAKQENLQIIFFFLNKIICSRISQSFSHSADQKDSGMKDCSSDNSRSSIEILKSFAKRTFLSCVYWLC